MNMSKLWYNFRKCLGKCIYPGEKKQIKDFSKLDVNKDRRISLNEFNDYYFAKKGHGPSNDEWMKFHFADKENDGFITISEFETFLNKEFI